MLRHKDAAVGTAAVLVPTPPTLCVHKPAVCGFVQLIAFDRKEINENSYEVLSGERPEYFIRVNSITRIEQIINDDYYQSEMVRLVRQRHEDAKKG